MDSVLSWFVFAVIGFGVAVKVFKEVLKGTGDEWKTWKREMQEDNYLTWCEVNDYGKRGKRN